MAQWQVGDLLENRETGRRRRITGVRQPGTFGTAHSAGPVYVATVVDEAGQPVTRGHSADIWAGSISYPTSDWTKVEEA